MTKLNVAICQAAPVPLDFAGGIEKAVRLAREAVEGSTPDVILLDNNLPDGQGANFALELSEDPRFAHIPVVMVSDWPTPFMYHKAEMAGVRHVVSKADFGARYIHSALSA